MRCRAQLRYPVELRTTPTVLAMTSTGVDIGLRTLVSDEALSASKRSLRPEELGQTWLKVTKSAESFEQRFEVRTRDSLTKTQVSRDAPDYFLIPQVHPRVLGQPMLCLAAWLPWATQAIERDSPC